MKASTFTRILENLFLAGILLTNFIHGEEISYGPRLLCVEVVDERDVGLGGVYCQQVNSALYRETLGPASRGGPDAGVFTGAVTPQGNCGIVVLPVMGSGTEAENKTALFVDGELVLVHPARGVKRVDLTRRTIRWKWSKALGRSIGTIKVVFEEERNQTQFNK